MMLVPDDGTRQPRHGRAGRLQRFLSTGKFFAGVMADSIPAAPVLRIAAIFFKSKAAIGANNDVDTDLFATLIYRAKDFVGVSQTLTPIR